MVKNKKILILEGGYNEEHKVSLNSSSEVQKVFNNAKIKYKVITVNPENFEKKIYKYKNYICFNALHGPFGEDGQIQKILRKNNLYFTHSNIKSSKISFNKIESKRIIKKFKILTPKYFQLSKEKLTIDNLQIIKKKI